MRYEVIFSVGFVASSVVQKDWLMAQAMRIHANLCI
jgi:hypothetical protein